MCWARKQLFLYIFWHVSSCSQELLFLNYFSCPYQLKQKELACMFLGAEHVLDELLIEKNQVGEWVYKEKHDHQLVSAVCIQIKGDIQFNLGQWSQGAKLLIESLILFRYCAKKKQ